MKPSTPCIKPGSRVLGADVAQAAKTARIIWAVLTSGQAYRAPAAADAAKS